VAISLNAFVGFCLSLIKNPADNHYYIGIFVFYFLLIAKISI